MRDAEVINSTLSETRVFNDCITEPTMLASTEQSINYHSNTGFIGRTPKSGDLILKTTGDIRV